METNPDKCAHCNGYTPEGVMLVVLAAKTGNQYHYCSEDCCEKDYDQRNLCEQLELDTINDWPKEI